MESRWHDNGSVPVFVDAQWVRARLPGLVLADVRWSLDGTEGRRTYRDGHLPGAVYIDLESVLSDPPSPEGGRHPLPSPERFASGLAAAGIGADALVVAYDQGPGTVAARLVWLLRLIGQPAALLDGGLETWPADELETGEVAKDRVVRHPVPWPADRLVDADGVARQLEGGDTVVLDAREPARYLGQHEPVDARAGHIPGARNLPTSANLDGDRLRGDDDLRRLYRQAGALDASEVVVYCGSGVTACHDLLVLEHLGIQANLFPGSWSAWAADERRPAAQGSVAGDQ